MKTADDILMAASDINCLMEVDLLIREVEQIFQSFNQEDRDAINFSLYLAKDRVNSIKWH